MEKELETAKTIAREAGKILLEYYKTGAEIQMKGDDSPVTAADHAANDFLVKELIKHFPNDAILSEELPDNLIRLESNRVWMVDPMDGTKQFIDKVGEFSVMIGLTVDNKPVIGVVYYPIADKMYYAEAGKGAYLEQKFTTKRIRVDLTTDTNKLTAAMSKSHHSSKVDIINDELGITHKIKHGSVGLKFGLIAEGIAHVYTHLSGKTNMWDTCGPEVILREAGGRITDMHGHPLEYNKSDVRNTTGIVATNGSMHEKVLKTIQTRIEN